MQERTPPDFLRRTPLIRLLCDLKLADNAGDARLAIIEGLVNIDGDKVKDPNVRYPNYWIKGKVLKCRNRQQFIK